MAAIEQKANIRNGEDVVRRIEALVIDLLAPAAAAVLMSSWAMMLDRVRGQACSFDLSLTPGDLFRRPRRDRRSRTRARSASGLLALYAKRGKGQCRTVAPQVHQMHGHEFNQRLALGMIPSEAGQVEHRRHGFVRRQLLA